MALKIFASTTSLPRRVRGQRKTDGSWWKARYCAWLTGGSMSAAEAAIVCQDAAPAHVSSR